MSIPNAVEENLNTVAYYLPCGCEIHNQRTFDHNGELTSMTPIDKYYGYSVDGRLILHETRRCERHANIVDITLLHAKIAEEGLLLARAKEIMVANLPSDQVVVTVDDIDGEIKSTKTPIPYSIDAQGNIKIFYGGIDSSEKTDIEALWSAEFGVNKVKFI